MARATESARIACGHDLWLMMGVLGQKGRWRLVFVIWLWFWHRLQVWVARLLSEVEFNYEATADVV